MCPVVTYVRQPGQTAFDVLSSAVETQFHLSPADLPHIEAWLGRVHPADQEHVRAAYATGKPYRLEYRVNLPNRVVRWVQDTTNCAEDGALVGAWVDISDQKETQVDLRQQLRFFQQTVEGTDATVFIQDTDLRYIWLYNGILSEEEVLGKRDRDIVADPLASELETTKQHVLDTEQPVSQESVVQRADGQVRYYQSLFQPYYDENGTLAGVRTLSINVTELREVQQKLAHQAQLIGRSNRDLERFAYAVSHDLQEPLRAITGYLDLLREEYLDKLDEDGLDFIDEAVSGATRMGKLIRGLLAYSRVDRKNRPLQDTPAADALADALANLVVILQETNASVYSANLPVVQADPTQLTLVFQNLINNALKFRSAEYPKIEIGAEKTEAGWVFHVKDNGIGIDPKYHGRIFGIFQRLHTRDEIEGTGMGLALCRRIMERHGGQIWVESELGDGATFKFLLPS